MSEVFGIDVSHYQQTIDWKRVAASGKKFAIMKAQYEAQAHRKDEFFERNYIGAGENGIKRGVYIYIARTSMADIEGDARSLLNHLQGRPLEYGIWLDLEDKAVAVKGKAYISELAYKYAKIFRTAGYFVGIYCNRDWYMRLIGDDLKRDFDMWIARYPKNDTGLYNPNSTLKPSPSFAVAWQYSSKGKVDGIKGNVDMDVDYDGNIDLVAGGEIIVKNPYREPASNIKKGMCGNAIKWIQYELNRHGAKIVIDGIFGEHTHEAVVDFQASHLDASGHALAIDGIVGPKTREALKNH